jgi:hypothetical protein
MLNKNNNETNYNHVLKNLQDYMLDDSLIKRIVESTNDNNSSNISINSNSNSNSILEKSNIVKKEKEYFIPKQKDTLFWCFYIMKNGIDQYDDLNETGISVVTEKQLKIGFVEKLRKEKPLIKIYKFASNTHIENQLVNENKIDISTFLTLCVLENLNIIYLKKKTYYELLMNDGNDIHVVNFTDYGKFGYKLSLDINNIRTTLFKIDNIEKPLKALSAYKLSELVEYCSKLDIGIINEKTNKKKNKNELYESLIQYF